jgi:hypothetical protein
MLLFSKNTIPLLPKGIENCIRTPELADNVAIHKLWKHFNPVINCRRKTFRKELLTRNLNFFTSNKKIHQRELMDFFICQKLTSQ